MTDDPQYGNLLWQVSASLIHLLAGVFMCFVSRVGWPPLSFSLSILTAPMFHLIGAGSNNQILVLICFFAPSLVTFWLGFVLWREQRRWNP